jgi:DNA repair photolyase
MDYQKGRGAQLNTANRFSQTQLTYEHTEGIDEEISSAPQTEVFLETPKKILSKVDSPDIPVSFSINPYQGCEHGCVYCYARNSHEYWGFSAGLDFEQKIMIKPDAPLLLEKEFLKKNWQPTPIALSGNTDCYQPQERKLRITRNLLKVFVKYANPVSIITKNSLITRDLDLLQDLASHRLVHVYISITTLDEALRLQLEPRTATIGSRLRTVRTLADAGIPVGVMIAPVIPGLNDSHLPAILQAAADHGAFSAGYSVVRLNGAVGELFEDWVRKNFPDRMNKIMNGIRALHGGRVNDSRFGTRMSGEGHTAKIISQLFKVTYQKHFAGRVMPPYDLTQFRRGGNLSLF